MKRLDKLLSDAGVAGRKDLKTMIRQGRVQVDGRTVTSPEEKFDETTVSVTVDGGTISTSGTYYYMMDKPAGVVTATEDRTERTVLDLLPPEIRRQGVFPVGRLDKDTTGLLLLTNDGDFAHQIISPKSHVQKCYVARVDGIPDEADVEVFRAGLTLKDGTVCRPAVLEIDGTDTCRVRVEEGKYHQVKRMLAARGKPVLALRRVSIGGLLLDETLGAGGIRPLTTQELSLALLILPL